MAVIDSLTKLGMKISIIVPAYDDEEALRLCLDHIKRSEIRAAECIVVCDAGMPATIAVAQTSGSKVICISGRRGPAFARNRGAAAATGDVLLFIDSDVCVHPDAIGKIAARLAGDHTADAVFGGYDESPRDTGFISQYKNLFHHYVHRSGAAEAATFWSGCGAIRTAVFRAVGGFDERYHRPSIEDIELGARLKAAGRRVILDPSIQSKHLKRWTLAGLLHTDFALRAIPWTRLILRSGRLPNQLNLEVSQRVSVGLVGLSCAALAAGLLDSRAILVAVAALSTTVFLNRRFYGFMKAKRGSAFALSVVPLHLLYFFYSGAGFLAGAALAFCSPKERSSAANLRAKLDAARHSESPGSDKALAAKQSGD